MNQFLKKTCVPCKSSQLPLKPEEIQPFHEELGTSWEVIDHRKLKKSYKFKNFSQALAFVNDIGRVAEEENHHPDIFLSWGLVSIEIFTHKIQGLSENDFILAAKIDALYISDTGQIS